MSPEERADLIAFLHALTDESALPVVPDTVPSGFAVIAHSNRRPPQERGMSAAVQTRGTALTHTVRAGASIQDAVDAARPGDTIEVFPGTYSETVLLDIDEVTLRGITVDGKRPVLDGRGELSDGIIGSGSGLEITGIDVRNYTANGVMLNLSKGIILRDITATDTGLYGLYPVESIGVLVEGCRVMGASDAGIYVGQCKDVVVRGCEVSESVTGIEIENCVDALVEENRVWDNAGGILVFLLPNNPSKVSRGCLVRDNEVVANNHVNFAAEGATVRAVPSGTGVLILAADDVEVSGNEIRGNKTCGVAVLSLAMLGQKARGGVDVDPWPDRVWIHDNELHGNGADPDPEAAKEGISGVDLLWDLTGAGNSWSEPGSTALPPLLPGPEWGAERRRFFRRLWRAAGA
jgi:parallel beta-helix repeat protein